MFLRNKKLEIQTQDEVHLQPIFGIQPEVYLACLYGAVIVAVLFFTLFYPGISNPGAVLLVESDPSGAAIFVDDVYQSATPAEIFVSEGERVVKMSLPGFSSQEQTINVKARIIASLFFPKKQRVRETLSTADPEKVFAMGASDFAAWSFAGEPTSAYQIPQPLSEAAYRIGLSEVDALNNILEATVRFASNRASLRDIIRARFLVDNMGIAASPLSLLASTQDALSYLNRNPAAASVLSSLIPMFAWNKIADSAWIKKNKEAVEKKLPVSPKKREGRVMAGLLWTEIVKGDNSFFLSETIPLWSWELFLEAEPSWAASGQALHEGVSWFAAKAYCKWLTAQIGADVSLLESARLPFKDELEIAARADFIFDGQKYEWCEDFFVPFDFLSADEKSIATIGSPERTVFSRDGEKASLPPDLYSPFISFRLAIK
jgi:hypothetical protein